MKTIIKVASTVLPPETVTVEMDRSTAQILRQITGHISHNTMGELIFTVPLDHSVIRPHINALYKALNDSKV